MSLYHSTKGSVNYTAVGSPTIVDGIASAAPFSTSKYIVIWNSFDYVNADFYIQFRIKIDGSSAGNFFAFGDGTGGFARFTNTQFLFRTNYSSENVITLQGVFDTGKFYFLKISKTGSTTTIGYSEDGKEWTQTSAPIGYPKKVNNIRLGVVPNEYSLGFYGSIDLNNTYIKVNGQPWFGVCPIEVQKHQLMGPVGYTVVGSPTIVDGIASGFSNSDYLALPYLRQQNWEIVLSFIHKSHSSYSTLLKSDGGDFGFYFRPNVNKMSVELGSWNFFLSEDYEFIPDNKYQIRFNQYDTDKHTYSITNMTTGTVVETGRCRYDFNRSLYGPIYIGTSTNSYSYSPIDLNETYIKANGKLWFWQPQETKYIVKDGKLVWADPRIYLQSTGTQYIQTNYIPTGGDAASVEFYGTTYYGQSFYCVYSAGDGNCQYVLLANRDYNATFVKNFKTGEASRFGFFLENVWIKFWQLGDNVDYLETGGNLYTTPDTYQAELDGDSKELRLFRRKDNTGAFVGKMKAFSITNGNVLKLHLVPVPQGLQIGTFTVPSNGMFDIVNQQFYANAGTGTFTIGRDE